MIKVYHIYTGVTNPSSTDTTSTTASTATDSVICWTCLGLTVNTAGEYTITCCIGIQDGNIIIRLYYLRMHYCVIQSFGRIFISLKSTLPPALGGCLLPSTLISSCTVTTVLIII